MPVQIEAITAKTAKPINFPQKKQSSPNNVEKEQNKKDSNSTNKLLLTLGGLAVIAGGIYFATRGKGSNAAKATGSLSTETRPASTLTSSGTQKNTNGLADNSIKGAEEVTPHISLAQEEEQLTGLITRETSEYSSLLKKLGKPEEIPLLPDNKSGLNGIFKTTEQDKTIYHLYENGEIKGKISPQSEGFLLKSKDNNSVFIWSDGEITHEIASKEELPPEIKKFFNSQYTEQEIGNIRITKADNRISISEIHPSIDDNCEHLRGISFSFVKSL